MHQVNGAQRLQRRRAGLPVDDPPEIGVEVCFLSRDARPPLVKSEDAFLAGKRGFSYEEVLLL